MLTRSRLIAAAILAAIFAPLSHAQLKYTHAVKTTTIVGAPNDANDGHDPIGFNLSGATYDHTGNAEGERHLSSVGAFASYTWVSGDWVWLEDTGGEDDILTGSYEIAEKVDDDAILLVDNDGLTNDSGADVDSSDGPWLTLQYMFDTAAEGSWVAICADGGGVGNAWEISSTLDIDTQDGGAGTITFAGANARGVSNGTVPVITDTGTGASLVHALGDFDSLSFLDLRFDGATQHCFFMDTGAQYYTFVRCVFSGAGSYGLNMQASTVAYDCDMYGCNTGVVSGYNSTLTRCRMHDNVQYGIYSPSSVHVEVRSSLVYGNGSHGIYALSRNLYIDGCVVFGNTGSGLIFNVGQTSSTVLPSIVYNTVFRSNGGYGIDNSNAHTFLDIDYCCFSNNTSGSTTGCDNYLGAHNIYEDPLFASEIDGNENFTPQEGSPLINMGLSVPVK